MLLRILTGPAHAGKTNWILERMRQNGLARKQLLLVPEQASFESERRFLRANGNRAGAWGEVLSLKRLENRVLSESGGLADPVLDDGGRMLVMYDVMKQLREKDALSAYAMASRRPEFIRELLATMDELRRCCVSQEILADAADVTEGQDADRLRDISLLYAAYSRRTAWKAEDDDSDYIGMEYGEYLTRLAEQMKSYPYAAGKDVYLDSFWKFTPHELLVLEQLMMQAESLTISLNHRPDGSRAFSVTDHAIRRVKNLAEKHGVPVEQITLENGMDVRPAALIQMDQHLFSEQDSPCAASAADVISCGSCGTPREEVQWAAGEIRRLVRSGRYRFRDIAVTARDMGPYRDQIEHLFEQYGIEVFRSDRVDILRKPVFSLLFGALEAVTAGYRYEDMFRLLKTGLAGLRPDQCDRVENYVLTWNIRGIGWKNEWKLSPGGKYAPSEKDWELEQLKQLNELREKVIGPLETLRRHKDRSVRGHVEALFSYLEEIRLPEALRSRTKKLQEQGRQELAMEYGQLWQILINALDQCVDVLGDVQADFSEFKHLLLLLLSAYSVAAIPASLDKVFSGEIERLRGREVKVLFLLGADSESIPKTAPSPSLLTESDRELLQGYGAAHLGLPEAEMDQELHLAYFSCSRPTDRLYVSWPRTGTDGSQKQPSLIVRRIQHLFPDAEQWYTAVPAPDQLCADTAANTAVRHAAELEGEESLQNRWALLDQAKHWSRGRLSFETAQELYGTPFTFSASRIDRINSCHFGYFAQYGLKAKERKPAGFQAAEFGDFVHYVLRSVFQKIYQCGTIHDIDDERLSELTEEAITDYTRETLGGLADKEPRFAYLFLRQKESVHRIVRNVADELRASAFQPSCFELGIGMGDEDTVLEPVRISWDGAEIEITGRIDRVDLWQNGDLKYLRVIDYKTGKKSLDMTDIEDGRNLQMLIYLFAMLRSEEEKVRDAEPAGILYVPVRDPFVREEKDRRTELRRKGLILHDRDVIEAMEDPSEKGSFLPDYSFDKKTGEPKGKQLITAEQFSQLSTHVERKLRELCSSLKLGNIDADPYWYDQQDNACTYCPYTAFCQFEEKAVESDCRRRLRKLNNAEFWAGLSARDTAEEGR